MINIKNTKFVKDLPMIDAQFRFNQCYSFREEDENMKFTDADDDGRKAMTKGQAS